MEEDAPRAPLARGLDPELRRVVASAVAGSTLGWWPAFTLGVYGVIFFEQHLALWAAATSAFLALMLAGGRQERRRLATTRCCCRRCGWCSRGSSR